MPLRGCFCFQRASHPVTEAAAHNGRDKSPCQQGSVGTGWHRRATHVRCHLAVGRRARANVRERGASSPHRCRAGTPGSLTCLPPSEAASSATTARWLPLPLAISRLTAIQTRRLHPAAALVVLIHRGGALHRRIGLPRWHRGWRRTLQRVAARDDSEHEHQTVTGAPFKNHLFASLFFVRLQ